MKDNYACFISEEGRTWIVVWDGIYSRDDGLLPGNSMAGKIVILKPKCFVVTVSWLVKIFKAKSWNLSRNIGKLKIYQIRKL